jgi:hypothetical protein
VENSHCIIVPFHLIGANKDALQPKDKDHQQKVKLKQQIKQLVDAVNNEALLTK